jgi:two-component system response regulator (stage 0 sporulation protein A)
MVELDRVGINPKSVGYAYLVDAIMIVIKKPTHNVCTPIAIKYKKSEACVERAMQNAINRAWRTNSTEDLLTWYTARINADRGNPTITEFICYYANKLRNEY